MALYKNLTKIIFALTIAFIIPLTSWASGDFWSDKQDVYRKCIANKLKAGDDITINVNELLTDCVQPVAGPDLLVESASMLFPETATRILIENNDGTEVSVVSLIFRNLLYKSSDWIFREIGFNPLDAYIDDSNYFANKTAIHKYSSKGTSGLAAFGVSIETGLKYVLRLLGYLSASLCLLVIFRRMGKAAYDGLGAMDIMVTTIKESPPIILALYLTAPPSHGGMPIIGEVMVAFLIFGALMSNVFSVFLTEVIYLFYGDGVVSISAGMDSDSHNKDINKHLKQYIERTSDNIVALDIIASNYLTKEIGLNKSNNAEFRAALEKHPFPAECILRPYWEMKIFSDPRCVDLKKYAIGKMSYEHLTWVKLHIKKESEMIPHYVKSGKPQNASNALYNDEMVKVLLDEAYSRADRKKAAICAMNPKLGNLNSYKGEWLCNQFDQKKGAFVEGSYLAPEYYNYLNNLNGEFPVESARKIAANYYSSAIDDNVTKSTIEAVKASARIQSSWVISELQNSIDVRSFTIRGIITSLWNSIYISNVVTKIAYQLQGEYISHHQKFFSYLNVLSPEIKTQPSEWVIDEDFKDENNLAATFAQFKKLSPTREEKESGGFLDINPDTIFAGLIGISPVACRNDNTKCLNLNTNPLSKIGGQVGIILNFSLLFTVGAHFISSIFNNADWATGLFEFLATATGGIAIALIAFTILPFFTYFFYSVLKVFVRVLVYTIAAPLVIIQFLIRKNSDEKYDEDNIFIPKDILGMGLRLLVDFLSISIALIGGLIMVYINISILTIMVSYITSAISIDESLSLLNLKSIISYSIVLILTLLAYIYSIYKAATLQPYIQEKVSEFAYTGFNLSTDKDNEAEVILGVLTPALGLLNNKN